MLCRMKGAHLSLYALWCCSVFGLCMCICSLCVLCNMKYHANKRISAIHIVLCVKCLQLLHNLKRFESLNRSIIYSHFFSRDFCFFFTRSVTRVFRVRRFCGSCVKRFFFPLFIFIWWNEERE